jgi:hypothetical protein
MTKPTDLESGAEARLHDTKTRDLLDAEHCNRQAELAWEDFQTTQAKDAQAEQQFKQAVRQLVRSRSYDEIRQLLDEELEGEIRKP